MVTADKGYDNDDNHLLVRDDLHAFSVIPARYEHVPIWRTHGRYGKEMKRGYSFNHGLILEDLVSCCIKLSKLLSINKRNSCLEIHKHY
ncbi:MAG: hypothetical protein WBQ25_20465 [Nitrososphaeraceae archaeon]